MTSWNHVPGTPGCRPACASINYAASPGPNDSQDWYRATSGSDRYAQIAAMSRCDTGRRVSRGERSSVKSPLIDFSCPLSALTPEGCAPAAATSRFALRGPQEASSPAKMLTVKGSLCGMVRTANPTRNRDHTSNMPGSSKTCLKVRRNSAAVAPSTMR